MAVFRQSRKAWGSESPDPESFGVPRVKHYSTG